MDFEDTEESKIFPNEAFGYWKVTVERPLRLAGTDPERVYKPAEIRRLKAEAEKDENAPPIIKPVLPANAEAAPLRGKFAVTLAGKPAVVQYEPDPGPAGHRAGPAAAPRGHPGIPLARGPALRTGRLVQPRGREGRIRDQLQPALLQADADAVSGGDPGRHPGPGARDGGIAGGNTLDMNETQNGRPPTTQTRKPSGESRLGGVPKRWETRRLKGVCLFEYGDSLAEDYRTNTGVPVYGSNGLIGHTLAPNTERECLIIGRKGSSGSTLLGRIGFRHRHDILRGPSAH